MFPRVGDATGPHTALTLRPSERWDRPEPVCVGEGLAGGPGFPNPERCGEDVTPPNGSLYQPLA